MTPSSPPGDAASTLAQRALSHQADCLAVLHAAGQDVRGLLTGNSDYIVGAIPQAIAALMGTDAAAGRRARHAWDAAQHIRWQMVELVGDLCVQVAQQYHHPFLELADRVQEGRLGALHAAQRFDPSRGVSWRGYARWWIRSRLSRTLEEHAHLLQIPSNVLAQRRRLRHVRSAARQAGHTLSTAQVAAQAGIAVHKLPRLLHPALQSPVSLDVPLTPHDDVPASSVLCGQTAEDVEAPIEHRRLAARLGALMETLTPQQQEVLHIRFLDVTADKRSLRAIGARIGVSQERVRQIEADAFRKLRPHLRAFQESLPSRTERPVPVVPAGCAVPGCDEPPLARDLCQRHYRALMRSCRRPGTPPSEGTLTHEVLTTLSPTTLRRIVQSWAPARRQAVEATLRALTATRGPHDEPIEAQGSCPPAAHPRHSHSPAPTGPPPHRCREQSAVRPTLPTPATPQVPRQRRRKPNSH